MQTLLVWITFVLAAALEVGGDALVRHGLRGRGLWCIAAGMLVLGGYGLLVNLLDWDFSRLLGVYVAFFAVLSILCGRFVFKETIPGPTWAGLGLIVLGGLTIQFGQKYWH
jgi:small multidrug resistance family-3 protein